MGKWAFDQLRAFVEYKAKLDGVPVLVVNTRNTSRRCSMCGCTDKRNRVSQSEFKCRSCEHIRLEVDDCNYAINSSVKHTYNVDQISSCIIIFNVQIKCHVALLLWIAILSRARHPYGLLGKRFSYRLGIRYPPLKHILRCTWLNAMKWILPFFWDY